MQTKNYNLIPLSIDQGLNRVPIGTAGGYIRLLEAPAAANVKIHLNEQNADGIPLKTYHAIEATNIEKIFVSCNAVAGEIITIVQANTAKDFRMVTPASDVKLSSLGSYESVALDQLDKIINPYNLPILVQGQSSSTTRADILNKTLECDKIKVNLSGYSTNDDGQNNFLGVAIVFIDDKAVSSIGGFQNDDGSGRINTLNSEVIIENCRGKNIRIETDCSDNKYVGYLIQEYTIK